MAQAGVDTEFFQGGGAKDKGLVNFLAPRLSEKILWGPESDLKKSSFKVIFMYFKRVFLGHFGN